MSLFFSSIPITSFLVFFLAHRLPHHSPLCSPRLVSFLSVSFDGSFLFSPPLHILLPSPSRFLLLCSFITSFHLPTLPQFMCEALAFPVCCLHTWHGCHSSALIKSHSFPQHMQLIDIWKQRGSISNLQKL